MAPRRVLSCVRYSHKNVLRRVARIYGRAIQVSFQHNVVGYLGVFLGLYTSVRPIASPLYVQDYYFYGAVSCYAYLYLRLRFVSAVLVSVSLGVM